MRKYKRKYVTLIFVPKDRGHTKTFYIPDTLFKLSPFLLILFVFILSDWVRLLFVRYESSKLEEMLDEKNRYMVELEGKIDQLEKDVTKLKSANDKLRALVGLNPRFDIGGPADIDVLEDNVRGLKSSFEEIFDVLKRREEYLQALPSISPTDGFITSEFGPRSDPMTGQIEFHSGIDIAAPHSTPVKSTGSGKVSKVGYEKGLGIYVIIKHTKDISTVYGHLSKVQTTPGKFVKRGDIIGYVGSTGKTTGPHVHYEVRYRGKSVNPRNYLLDRG